jgi:hypothetical protein
VNYGRQSQELVVINKAVSVSVNLAPVTLETVTVEISLLLDVESCLPPLIYTSVYLEACQQHLIDQDLKTTSLHTTHLALFL